MSIACLTLRRPGGRLEGCSRRQPVFFPSLLGEFSVFPFPEQGLISDIDRLFRSSARVRLHASKNIAGPAIPSGTVASASTK
jgi:hypothetical protein